MRVLVALLAAYLMLGPAFAEQHEEKELAEYLDDQAQPLFLQSCFARGYLHGYEDGFHAGNEDYQFAQPKQPDTRLRQQSEQAPKGTPGSDRRSFHAGYANGFMAGYNDSVSGNTFRALGEIRAAAENLEAPLPPPALKVGLAFAPMSATGGAGEFDRAFSAGYVAGFDYTQENSRPINDFTYILSFCMSGKLGKVGPSYCDAFARGFRLGYNDGQLRK